MSKKSDPTDQLFKHLMIKYFFKYNPDQMGVLIESELPEWPGRYVVFHDGERCVLLDFDEDQVANEFSTISYGPLN